MGSSYLDQAEQVQLFGLVPRQQHVHEGLDGGRPQTLHPNVSDAGWHLETQVEPGWPNELATTYKRAVPGKNARLPKIAGERRPQTTTSNSLERDCDPLPHADTHRRQ